MPAVFGSKEARFGVIIFPYVEKSLSHGTLVAGIHSNCFATCESVWKRKWLLFHHFKRLSSMAMRSSANTSEIPYLLPVVGHQQLEM